MAAPQNWTLLAWSQDPRGLQPGVGFRDSELVALMSVEGETHHLLSAPLESVVRMVRESLAPL